VSLLLLFNGHVVVEDGGVHVDEVTGVDGHEGVRGNISPGEKAVTVCQVLEGGILNETKMKLRFGYLNAMFRSKESKTLGLSLDFAVTCTTILGLLLYYGII
jgi:hypothetical protein